MSKGNCINFLNLIQFAINQGAIMTLFERIKETAKKQGLTLSSLERKAGLSENSLYSWKRSNPKTDNLQKIADVLHVSMDYLLGRIVEMNPCSENLTEAQKQIAYFIDPAATKEDIEQIKQLVKIAKLSKHRL